MLGIVAEIVQPGLWIVRWTRCGRLGPQTIHHVIPRIAPCSSTGHSRGRLYREPPSPVQESGEAARESSDAKRARGGRSSAGRLGHARRFAVAPFCCARADGRLSTDRFDGSQRRRNEPRRALRRFPQAFEGRGASTFLAVASIGVISGRIDVREPSRGVDILAHVTTRLFGSRRRRIGGADRRGGKRTLRPSRAKTPAPMGRPGLSNVGRGPGLAVSASDPLSMGSSDPLAQMMPALRSIAATAVRTSSSFSSRPLIFLTALMTVV